MRNSNGVHEPCMQACESDAPGRPCRPGVHCGAVSRDGKAELPRAAATSGPDTLAAEYKVAMLVDLCNPPAATFRAMLPSPHTKARLTCHVANRHALRIADVVGCKVKLPQLCSQAAMDGEDDRCQVICRREDKSICRQAPINESTIASPNTKRNMQNTQALPTTWFPPPMASSHACLAVVYYKATKQPAAATHTCCARRCS